MANQYIFFVPYTNIRLMNRVFCNYEAKVRVNLGDHVPSEMSQNGKGISKSFIPKMLHPWVWGKSNVAHPGSEKSTYVLTL